MNKTYQLTDGSGGRMYVTVDSKPQFFLRSAKTPEDVIDGLNKITFLKLHEGDEFTHNNKVVARYVDGHVVKLSPANGTLTVDDQLAADAAKETEAIMATKEKAAPKAKAPAEPKAKATPKAPAEPKAKATPKAPAEPKPPRVKKDHPQEKLFHSFQARIKYMAYMDNPAAPIPGVETLGWTLTYRAANGVLYKAMRNGDTVTFFTGSKELINVKLGSKKDDFAKALEATAWVA